MQLIIQNDIPQLTDTVAVAKQKLDNFRRFIGDRENSILVNDRSSLAPGSGQTTPEATKSRFQIINVQ
jgi:hypothetical protein